LGNREIWVMSADAEDARRLYQTDEQGSFIDVQWSPDGRRLAYRRRSAAVSMPDASLETRDLNGGPPSVITPPRGPYNFRWLADGRMIFSVDDPPGERANLQFLGNED
jgi:Tol biopolymer transport system component